jgi:hypothetical protein
MRLAGPDTSHWQYRSSKLETESRPVRRPVSGLFIAGAAGHLPSRSKVLGTGRTRPRAGMGGRSMAAFLGLSVRAPAAALQAAVRDVVHNVPLRVHSFGCACDHHRVIQTAAAMIQVSTPGPTPRPLAYHRLFKLELHWHRATCFGRQSLNTRGRDTLTPNLKGKY